MRHDDEEELDERQGQDDLEVEATSADEEDLDEDDDDLDDEDDGDDAEDAEDDRAATSADGEPPEVSRKVRRRRRRTRPRSKTIAMKRLTREECRGDQRPCPWVACKYHLYLDVNPETGSIKLNFPDLEPWELPHTCSLDVAERGGITLEEVGEIMNLTRERIRQVEVRGLIKLKMSSPTPDELGAHLLNGTDPDDPVGN